MNRHFYILITIFMLICATMIYGVFNDLNPNSWFCLYKIYYQTNDTYEVWWVGRSCNLEGTFETYDQAKHFQIHKCDDWTNHGPQGKHVN